MTSRFVGSGLATAFVLFALTSPASANLIVNGSFEAPTVPLGGGESFTAASATQPTGWTVVGPGALTLINTSFTQFGFSFPAQDGAQWLDLTGVSSNQAIGIQQVVATTPGTTYDLSFWVGNVAGFINASALTSKVNVLVDGALAFAATNTGGGRTLTWQEFATSFTASGTTTTIRFVNGDPTFDESNGLDNVLLNPGGVVITPVPEPTTVAMFGVGLAGLMLRLRRRFDNRSGRALPEPGGAL